MESKNSNVELPTVSSQVLILVMKLMYTGKVVPEDLRSSTSKVLSSAAGHGTLQLDWNFLVEALATTRFLMLDQLGRILLDQLLDDTPQGGFLGEVSLVQLAVSYSLLHKYPSIWTVDAEGNSIEVISGRMIAALRSHDLTPAVLSKLFQAAFESYLEKTRETSEQEFREFLLDEYLRVREILTWCGVFSGTGTADLSCLPGATLAMDFIYAAAQDKSSRPVFYPSMAAVASSLRFESKVLSWEITLIPRGSLEQQSLANFEFGFIALNCGETFSQDVISPISADSRYSVIRVGSDLKTAYAFCEGREVHKWNLPPNDQFQWRKPFKVTVAKVGRLLAYVKGYTTRGFWFYTLQDKLVYPVIYWKLEGCNQTLYRPHYDQLTVEINTITDCGNFVAVKSSVSLGP
ncbi:hypothetical protein R1sor_015740 [Riccia sorocarpa]|uniref:BTB/POZ domain-containing protein n=1 Tax=Riccia sorocarpa TaxID=122646 RepID=A0ABD3HEV9_9MARC